MGVLEMVDGEFEGDLAIVDHADANGRYDRLVRQLGRPVGPGRRLVRESPKSCVAAG